MVEHAPDEGYATMITPPTRAAFDAPPKVVSLESDDDASRYLDELERQVPRGQWIVVVDGEFDPWAETIVESVYERGRATHLLHVTSEERPEREARVNGYDIVPLDPADEADRRFADTLPADVVLIPARAGATERTLGARWSQIARFVLSETSADLR